jgi:cytochrome c oxidase subunit II
MMPSRIQSALDATGIQAGRIEWLWWLMFWVCAVVFVLVLGAVFLAVRRGRAAEASRPSESTLFAGVTAAVGVTVVTLFGLLYASVAIGRAVGSPPDNALTIKIVGHRWWWEVEYVNPNPSLTVTSANELRLPVGRPIVLELRSADVIHSFWVPNLHGKTDLIPGRRNMTWLQADVAGTFRGQCAEYCGVQHAHMSLAVFAEEPSAFERWLTAQRRAAPPPATADAIRGLQVVERGPCMLCHTIRGTQAGARVGPDLTHFATRATIAAGTRPNSTDDLDAWIADPQHVKPGNLMPPTRLSPDDRRAVVAYLQTLK